MMTKSHNGEKRSIVTVIVCLSLAADAVRAIWVNHDFAEVERALDDENFFYPEDEVQG